LYKVLKSLHLFVGLSMSGYPVSRIFWGGVLGALSLSLGVAGAHAESIEAQILQLNDIYEIAPIQGRGGLARIATLQGQLRRQNPNTISVMAGDFLSPSALGTAKVGGERLAGRQMVDVLNIMGLDYATFGNHEFDLTEKQFRQRLAESKFRWFSSNTTEADGRSYPQVARTIIHTFKGKDGGTFRVGLIGLTLDANKTPYVQYQSVLVAARREVQQLTGKVDAIVAVTHQNIAEDRQLAAEIPQIDLILGGHEHENIQQWRSVARVARSPQCPRARTPIFKADANGLTIYVHRLRFDTITHCLGIDSQIQEITAALPEEPQTAAAVQKWQKIAFDGFRADGFEPERVIATTTVPLDGLETSVRQKSTNLTKAIAAGILKSGDFLRNGKAERAELSMFNGGSIRLDDVLAPGKITEYDIIRTLPFGGKVVTVELRGDLLARALDVGVTNRGSGGYLQTSQVERVGDQWSIGGRPLEPQRLYRVATTDFLVSGKERNLDFLKVGLPGVRLLQEGVDVRRSLIQQLQSDRLL
jgi:5'-nucleotidase / UDP-sugar diphosphatase